MSTPQEESIFGAHYPTDKKLTSARAAEQPLPEEYHYPQLFFYRIGVGEEKNWLPGEAAAYCNAKDPSSWPAAAAKARAAHPKPEVVIAPPPEGPPPSADQTPLREGETGRFYYAVPGAKDVNGFQIYYYVDADKVPSDNPAPYGAGNPYTSPGLEAALSGIATSQVFKTAVGVFLEQKFPEVEARREFISANMLSDPIWNGALQQLYVGSGVSRAWAGAQKGVGGNMIEPLFTMDTLAAALAVIESYPR